RPGRPGHGPARHGATSQMQQHQRALDGAFPPSRHRRRAALGGAAAARRARLRLCHALLRPRVRPPAAPVFRLADAGNPQQRSADGARARVAALRRTSKRRANPFRLAARFVCRAGRPLVAEVENVQTGERRRVTSRYLLGIDGASSTVRRALGFAMIGEDGSTQRAFMGGTMLSFFIRSPTLMAASKRPPTNMTWILNPEMRGMMYAQDGRETWVVHYQVPRGRIGARS